MIVRELVTLLGFKTDTASLRRAEQSIRRVSQGMTRTGRTMTFAFTAPILALGIGIVKTAGNFEFAMNRVQVLTNATGEQFEKLRNQAKFLGRTTQFSATQAADAMIFLAQAGFDTNEIYEALPATLNLAAASKQDLATTADQLSNIMQGFGESTKEAGRVADVLALAASSSNTNVTQLAEAMKFAAPMARLMGMSIEETSAILGLMGNAGIQATLAGTGLRMSLAKLLKVADSDRAKKALNKLGVAVSMVAEDGTKLLRPFIDILRDLESAGAGAQELEAIFGIRGMTAVATVIQQGTDKLGDFTNKLKDKSFGIAAKQAKSQMKGLLGAWKGFVSAIEGFAIKIGDSGLLKWTTDFITELTRLVRGLIETNPVIINMGLALAGVLALSGPLLIFLGLLGSGIATLMVVTLPMIAGFFAFIAVLALVVLAIDDLYVWIKGGDSLIGRWVGNWKDARDNLIPIWESIKTNFKSLMAFMATAWVDPEKAGRQFGEMLAGLIRQIEEFPLEALKALFHTLTFNLQLGAKAGKFLLDEAVRPLGEGVGEFAFGVAQGTTDVNTSEIPDNAGILSRIAASGLRILTPIDITLNTEVNVPEGTTPDQADEIGASVGEQIGKFLLKDIRDVITNNPVIE